MDVHLLHKQQSLFSIFSQHAVKARSFNQTPSGEEGMNEEGIRDLHGVEFDNAGYTQTPQQTYIKTECPDANRPGFSLHSQCGQYNGNAKIHTHTLYQQRKKHTHLALWWTYRVTVE